MSVFLRINGWEIKSLVGSVKIDTQEYGYADSTHRNYKVKRSYGKTNRITGELIRYNDKSTENALSNETLMCLLNNQFHHIDFERFGDWSDGGLRATGVTSIQNDPALARFGEHSMAAGGSAATWNTGYLNEWSVIVWVNFGSGYVRYVIRSDGVKFRNDIISANTTPWMAETSPGIFSFTNLAGTDGVPARFDDIVFIPCKVSQTFIEETYNWQSSNNLPFSSSQNLWVDGEITDGLIKKYQTAFTSANYLFQSNITNSLTSGKFELDEQPSLVPDFYPTPQVSWAFDFRNASEARDYSHDDGFMSYFPFTTGSPNNDIMNGQVMTVTAPAATGVAGGFVGQMAVVPGTGALTVPSAFVFAQMNNKAAHTVSTWIRVNGAPPAERKIYTLQNAVGVDFLAIYIRPGRNLRVVTSDGTISGTKQIITSTASINTFANNAWFYLSATVDRSIGRLRVFIDERLVGETDWQPNVLLPSSRRFNSNGVGVSLTVGGTPGQSIDIDELAIYSVERTQAQIIEVRRSNLAGNFLVQGRPTGAGTLTATSGNVNVSYSNFLPTPVGAGAFYLPFSRAWTCNLASNGNMPNNTNAPSIFGAHRDIAIAAVVRRPDLISAGVNEVIFAMPSSGGGNPKIELSLQGVGTTNVPRLRVCANGATVVSKNFAGGAIPTTGSSEDEVYHLIGGSVRVSTTLANTRMVMFRNLVNELDTTVAPATFGVDLIQQNTGTSVLARSLINTELFNGQIAWIGLYDRLLTNADIYALYRAVRQGIFR